MRIQTCTAHEDCVVVFQGYKCPWCESLDERAALRKKLADALTKINEAAEIVDPDQDIS